MAEQLIKTYRSGIPHITSVSHRFRMDAAKLARLGWRIQSQSAAQSSWGLSKHTISVVYVRQERN